ncbi:MAG TPA: L-aspartate oxidase [Cyanobacteria bacterium UBA11149]|nr:L-aspartate oxidase [Cyanobacteria bacterium UBA11367]HBE59606.1 L-aspartate oxidase [Cyanobacteria bacterium UBA11366]HBK65140.1 L-aspartate oxidase [Cyanobacteria bacterium UBA11166]HBR75445.1 L-aspartate oxidase [Cyanobacteria bacterium UBA11159]HBS70013.1 L-aspartate oxidase [Cyanobacteria bacterium UBA11153]HBW91990.1 L-aspartate oxidase [Cyanobacteria bacterium UBA11149]HCA94122.1 L-aspartate oxidase [Cyanobacteria bacterium UBA9226]
MNTTNYSSSNLPSQFDIIIVGSGAAGLYATLCLPEKYRVLLVSKDKLRTGSSKWAQGGIAAAIGDDDSPQLHLKDTLHAGAGICDRAAVEFLVENAPSAIDSLLKLGVAFDRKQNKLATTLEAAHSRPRVLHAQDTTGRAIVDILTAKVLAKPNIQVLPQALALSLWLNPQTHRCQGISILHENQIIWLRANAIVLATGGGGQIFAKTTNPSVSTGDGVALAWRSGAVVRDLEFVQFHPTALSQPDAPHFLISEAVRGEGAHLVDIEGRRFAFDYHPQGELAPRDVVSRAIFSHLEKTAPNPANANVYLDLRGIETAKIRYRFPNIIQKCQEWGINLFQQPIPVAPAAHYWMGGVAVDLMNATSIEGLYAIGETASTGVHGANRLASNSLLECIVFAAQLHKLEVETINITEVESLAIETEDWSGEIEEIELIRKKLPAVMWHSAGICRTQSILEEAIVQVSHWRSQLANLEISKYILNLPPNQNIQFQSVAAQAQLKLATETLNLLDIGYLILKSAAFRTESRGGHYRTDYPETSETWQVHTVVEGDVWQTSPIY